MQKFSELQYKRPDVKALTKLLKNALKGVKKASSYEELRKLYLDVSEAMLEPQTMGSIAHIRNSLDMNDKFYEEEVRYLNTALAKQGLLGQKLNKALLASPFRKQMEEEFGSLFMHDMEVSLKLMNPKIIPMMIQEHKLTQQYSKDAATASCDFRGEKCNFYGLLKHMSVTDREERKEAFEAWAKLYESISDKLDATYDKLVALRVKKAKALGFDNFIDYVYLARQRYDYNAADAARFRDQVRDEIVPLCNKLFKEQAERLGVDKLHFYDEDLVFPDGNANPKGTKDELVQKALEMYKAMSPETGEFFSFMVENELFDLETRPGKHMGGYCTFLPLYKAPFIFSNFNGTPADVDVLTHEAGHAFEAYICSRTQPLLDFVWSTSEINEIHSMSMEHFAYPYIGGFVGEENADKYRYGHLVGAVTCIPYLVAVDEFQHRVFENPTMTAKERRAVWHKIEDIYLPWRDYDGNEFLSEGGFWMQKQHIFLYPFYYIDYALAGVCAFQFYAKERKDHKTAWADYLRLCKAGGSKGYFELLKLANLDNPFEPGTVGKVVESVKEALAELGSKL